MPRTARIVVAKYPHHITQRGNNKQMTFIEEKDCQIYLKLFEKYREKYSLDTLAYCLMLNHVHVSAIPQKENSLAMVFRSCHMRYAQYFNKKYKRTGHLWQCRFYSCAMDNQHLYSAIRYIENNPVRAGFVKKASDWKWSSARTHLGKNKSIITLANSKKLLHVANWGKYLNLKDDESEIKKLRESTYSGKPLGGKDFIQNLAAKFGSKVKHLTAGRPKK